MQHEKYPDWGLMYPLRGECYATAPEIATALWAGARVDILQGWIIPWHENWDERPFALFALEVQRRRAEAKAAGDSVGNLVWKLLGNSVYGKTGQGFSGSKAYNPGTGQNELVGPSQITVAAIAAYTTGLVRGRPQRYHRRPADERELRRATPRRPERPCLRRGRWVAAAGRARA